MLNFAFRYAILNMYAADCGFIRKNGDPMTKITKSADETEALGAYIASILDKKTSFVALYGEIGAGKTAFVRGFASVISPGSRVKSPTYTVVNEYRRGEIPLFHFDLYRLSSPEELDSLGFDEYVSSGICIAEWPDMLGDDLPENAVKVYIRRIGENEREITAEGIEDIADADGGDSRR